MGLLAAGLLIAHPIVMATGGKARIEMSCRSSPAAQLWVNPIAINHRHGIMNLPPLLIFPVD
jgi:hypothetical protein